MSSADAAYGSVSSKSPQLLDVSSVVDWFM